MTTPDLSALMSLVVADVSAAMGYTVHYQHGHMLEIANVVKQLSADQDIDKRYPLIALQQDVRLKSEPYLGVAATFKMYIITLSDPKYVAQQRIDNIFEPYLRPIFDELLSQIAGSQYFESASVEQVKERLTWYERLFWGKEGIMGNDANIFGDWVDCIELDFSDLVVYAGCEPASVLAKPRLITGLSNDTFRFIYLVWDKLMNNLAGIEYVKLYVNGVEYTGTLNCYRAPTDFKISIIELTGDAIDSGSVITISFPAELFESTFDDIHSDAYTHFPISNNVS